MSDLLDFGLLEASQDPQKPQQPSASGIWDIYRRRPPTADELRQQQGFVEGPEALLQDWTAKRDQLLQQSVSVALKSNPNFVAEAQRIGLAIAVDPRQVEQDIDGYRQVMQRVQLDRWHDSARSPALRWQMMDPAFARMAHDDLPNLGAMERLFVGLATGGLTTELGFLEHRRRDTGLGGEEQKRASAIGTSLRVLGALSSGGAIETAGEILGNVLSTTPQALAEGSAAAMAAGTTVALAGQAGPQLFVPEEAVTVPAATALGFVTGTTLAFLRQSYEIEGGLSYRDQIAKGIDPTTAAWVSRGVGVTNAVLELAGGGLVLKAAGLTGPIRRSIMRGISERAAEALARPGVQSAALGAAKGYLLGVTAEPFEEGLQEIAQILGEEAGRSQSGLPLRVTTPEGRAELTDRVAEVIAKTAKGMSILALPGAGSRFVMESARIRSSQVDVQNGEAMTQLLAKSKVLARNPDAIEAFTNRAVAGKRGANVYVDAARFAEALQQSGIPEEELNIPDVLRQLPDALATGGDMVIPTGRYNARIENTELGKALQEHRRYDSESYSAAELPDVEASVKELGKQAIAETEAQVTFAESARAVEEAFQQQVEATGRVDRKVARDSAATYRAFVETQAEAMGVQPQEFTEQFPLQVLREAPEGEALGQGVGPRAQFFPGANAIVLHKKAQIDSVLHELGHAFLHWYGQIAVMPEAPGHITDAMDAFLRWRGIQGGAGVWNAMSLEQKRPHHEALAEAFEKYAFDGEAPSLELQDVFSRIRRWITRLWRLMRRNLPEVPPEVRAIFDRMLASEEAIAHAESVRGLTALFQERPEGMSDAGWAKLQRRKDQATEAAVADVQKRSLRDMEWLGRAQGRKLREMQRKHNEERARIRAEVEAQVEAEPVQRAVRFIRTGMLVTEAGTEVDFQGSHKLQTDAVRELVPDGTDLRALRMTSPEGLAPDQVAEMFGFDSGQDLVTAILAARKPTEVIDEQTDQRMTAEHAELVDAAAVQRAVNEALHNPARARSVATELNELRGGGPPVRLMVAAARRVAKDTLSGMPVAQIKPWRFQAAERRANRAALKAHTKGDTAAAMQAKWSELLQHEMVREAGLIEREVEKAEARFRKFTQSDKKLAAYRDLDFVLAGRALLADYGVVRKAEGQAARQQERAMDMLARDFAPVHTRVQALRAESQRRAFRTLPLDEFRELVDTADALWDLSLSTKTLTIADRKFAMAELSKELRGALDALPKRRARGAQPPSGITPGLGARGILKFWHAEASLKRLHHWVRFMDGGKPDGPFERLILRPMIAQIDKYRAHRHAINLRIEKRLRKLENLYGARWDSKIAARPDELPAVDERGRPTGKGYVFRGVRELVDVIMDIGNTSNLAKRLVGEGWAPNPKDTNGILDTTGWDRFFERMIEDGTITRDLMEFVSSIWREFEALREPAQKVHRETLGREFEELELLDVVLPEELGGTIRGGYAPLRVDWARSRTPRLQLDALESLQGLEQEYEYSRHAVGTGRGFTITRNPNYYDRLTMDIGRRVQAFDAELRFIYLQPHVRNVVRMTEDREFKDAMNAYDREAIRSIILPWLDSTARQATSRPGKTPFVDAIANFIYAGTGVAFLGWKATVTLVQLTGFAQSGQYVSRKYRLAGMRRSLGDARGAWNEATEKSVRMADRLKTHMRKTEEWIRRQGIAPLPRTWDAFKKEGARFAMLPIRLSQGLVDVMTWHGAYQQSIAEAAADADMEAVEAMAIQDADLAVERSQGASNPENLARFQADTPTMRLMFQFLTFSNVMLNQSLVRAGLSPNLVRAVGNFLWMPVVIAFWETVIRESLAGLPDDDDDGYLDDLAKALGVNFGRNVAGMVPLFGPAIAAMASNEADRISTAPAVAAIASGWRGVRGLFQEDEMTGSEIRALGDFASMVTGWPMGIVARPLAFAQDVEQGKVRSEGDADFIRGLLVGR